VATDLAQATRRGPDVELVDAGHDSRRVRPGWLFCAIRGAVSDGHDHAWEAVDRGAAALLVVLLGYAGTRYCLGHQAGGVRSLQRLVEPGQAYTIFATVADWPRLRERGTDIKLEVDSLRAGHRCFYADGALLLQVSDTTTLLRRGDGVSFRSRVYSLPVTANASFDYSRYLRLKGIHGRVYLTTLLNVRIDRRNPLGFLPLVDYLRMQTVRVFEQCLSPPAAALAKGLMLGETQDIDPQVYQMFRDSGTLHLLAVSGSNVALVLLVFHLLLRPFRFQPRTRYLLLLLVIVLYAGMCRAEPSVIRASVMAGLVIGARLLGRKIDLNHIVAVTAVIILLVDPAQLFDVGFQLSFVTAWGLIFIVPRITKLLEKHHQQRWYRWLVFPLIISLVAQICSTPLIVLYFERLPVISIPANLIVVPLVTVCVFGLAALLLSYLVLPVLGRFVGSLVDLLHHLVLGSLRLMGGERMPVMSSNLQDFGAFGWLVVVACYGVLVLAALALHSRRARRLLVFCGLALTIGLVGNQLWTSYSRHPQIVFARIPGGVVVVNPLGGGQADLIVTSLIGRDYAIDEVILKPLLAAEQVDSVRYLFLLAADYAALDDVWRLQTSCRVDSLFAPGELQSSLRETASSTSGATTRLTALSEHDWSAAPADGYLLTAPALVIQRPSKRLVILRPGGEVEAIQSGPPGILVISRTWRPSADQIERLERAGFGPLVATDMQFSDQAPLVSNPEESARQLVNLKSLGHFFLPVANHDPDDSCR